VDHEVAVIQEHPGGIGQAFDLDRLASQLLQLALDLLGDRLDLPDVVAAGDDEGIGDTDDVPDVEHERVGCVLGRRRPGGGDATGAGVVRGTPPWVHSEGQRPPGGGLQGRRVS
jgi:hypothetical protein